MPIYAVIDIGSNTVRLVIYQEKPSGRYEELHNVKIVARLREDLTEDLVLTEAGIKKLIHILTHFNNILDEQHVDTMICAATAAIRQAVNREDVKRRVSQETGLTMRILSEEEEAYYGFLAVKHSIMVSEAITIDIGGGSTELTYFKDRDIQESISLPFGALTLKRRFFNAKEDKASLEKLLLFLQAQFEAIPWLQTGIPVIAIGGSARNLALIHQGLHHYPIGGLHQYEMDPSEIPTVLNELISLDVSDRQKVEGLSKDRADIIIPAISSFQALCECIEAPKWILSRKGLREGLLYEMIHRSNGVTQSEVSVLDKSMTELENDFGTDTSDTGEVVRLAKMLADLLEEHRFFELEATDRKLLESAGRLFQLGQYIDREAASQHTFYVLSNRTIDGLFHEQRVKLALVASFHSKSRLEEWAQPFKGWFYKKERKTLSYLGSLLKFSKALNATDRKIVEAISLKEHESHVEFIIHCRKDCLSESYQAEKYIKHIEKAIKKEIVLTFEEMGM
ncbi:Ppx/GppA family phosphatase [Aureibacillus halotolerans]|uniref:Exopolyphosphatase/guanosine-5'-triphosphate, 3'-diphosphate pyrophosphatase n=1 Tax=Aureibacillus halotolerans TaxID=1508390 RepID=A0A4R6TRZ1_9BACI|nr:Ppx/GppA family phosphatase [Aureibacillus halotolerans]TDQ35227.1 exopolyphosphatase/guanosine-5'-triphosphate,3'-diphosphate pyrophosphatase [Aureibacillus halotolerans]